MDPSVSQKNGDVLGVWSISSFDCEYVIIDILQCFVKAFTTGEIARQVLHSGFQGIYVLVVWLVKRNHTECYCVEKHHVNTSCSWGDVEHRQ